MEQLTLEQATEKHFPYYEAGEDGKGNVSVLVNNGKRAGFKAGAEWQKEQYKELIILARQLLGAYDVRYPDAKQLLVGYTNEEAFNKLNSLLDLNNLP